MDWEKCFMSLPRPPIPDWTAQLVPNATINDLDELMSRFIPIIGQVALAGLLAQKRYIPESAGTLKTDTVTFAVMTFAVIFIVAALSFFPAQALTTLTEHFTL